MTRGKFLYIVDAIGNVGAFCKAFGILFEPYCTESGNNPDIFPMKSGGFNLIRYGSNGV